MTHDSGRINPMAFGGNGVTIQCIALFDVFNGCFVLVYFYEAAEGIFLNGTINIIIVISNTYQSLIVISNTYIYIHYCYLFR